MNWRVLIEGILDLFVVAWSNPFGEITIDQVSVLDHEINNQLKQWHIKQSIEIIENKCSDRSMEV